MGTGKKPKTVPDIIVKKPKSSMVMFFIEDTIESVVSDFLIEKQNT